MKKAIDVPTARLLRPSRTRSAVLVAGAALACGCFPNLDRFHQEGASGSKSHELAGDAAPEDADSGRATASGGSGGAPKSDAGHAGQGGRAGDDAGDSGNSRGQIIEAPYLDLRVTLVAMKPHNMSFFELYVIDANNMIQAHAVLDPMGTENATINMPLAVPKLGGPYRLDFYGDMNGTRTFDGLGSVIKNDHAWRLSPLEDYPKGAAHENGRILVNFVHNTIFTDIDQYPSGTPNKAKASGVDARVDFAGMTAYTGKFMQVRVREKVTGHMVGLYRFPAVPEEKFTALLPGVVDVGVDYHVDVYIDANGDGTYDNPEESDADRGYRLDATSDMGGLRVAIDPTSAAYRPMDVGAP